MKTKILILILLTTLISLSPANAQWRLGVTAGATHNKYSINTPPLNDVHYTNAWGGIPGCDIPVGTFGFMAQYDISHWLGLRTDLNWTYKNYKMSIPKQADYELHNAYIQLPVMASFSIGYKNFRGFCNLGIYGGYWLRSHKIGTEEVVSHTISGKIKYDFNSHRDQRFDYGLTGGTGVEWRLGPNWAWQIVEVRVYYSTQSSQKQYMTVKDPRYNTTIALQSGLCYLF